MKKLDNGKTPIVGKIPKMLIRPIANLARCQTASQALAVLATIPEKWLPRVAEYMAYRTFFRPEIVRMAITSAGLTNLKRDLGKGRTDAIINLYFNTDDSRLQERFEHATNPGFCAFLDALADSGAVDRILDCARSQYA